MSDLRSISVAHFNVGTQLYKKGLFKQALEEFYKSIEKDPSFYSVHFWIAKALIGLEQYDDSTNHFLAYYALFKNTRKSAYSYTITELLLIANQYKKALDLLEKLKISSTPQYSLAHLSVLLANDKQQETYEFLLSEDAISKIESRYNKLICKSNIPAEHRTAFSSDNIVLEYCQYANWNQLLETTKIPIKQYIDSKERIGDTLKKLTKATVSSRHSLFDKLNKDLLSCQKCMADHLSKLISRKDVKGAKEVLVALDQTKYDSKKLELLSNNFEKLREEKQKKKQKNTYLIILGFLLMGVSAYFIDDYLTKQKVFKATIAADSINQYDRYLKEYGDDPVIDQHREMKFYKNALTTSSSFAINLLLINYPQSQFLEEIKFSDGSLVPTIYGIQSDTILHNSPSSFKLPKGVKVQYDLQVKNALPIHRVFTVGKSITIEEKPILRSSLPRWKYDHQDSLVPNRVYYCWTNELNVRSGPNRNDRILTTIKLGDPIQYLGARGSQSISAKFRSARRPDYYYRVKLLNGSTGWVHGGALQGLPTKESISLDDFKTAVSQ